MTFYPTVPISQVKPNQYKHFNCGIAELDEYLKRFAKNNEKKGIGRNFMLLSDNQVVIGYYTLCMARYPALAARLCRLAVDQTMQGNGIGEHLLMDAIQRVIIADQSVAAHSLIVDVKNAKAKSFYQKHEFIPLRDQELKLFLPLTTLRSL